MFATVMGVIGTYVALRVVGPLGIPLWGKLLLGAAILMLAENHLLTRYAYGNMFSLELPRAVVIAVNLGFGAILITAALHLLLDLAMLVRSLQLWQWRPLASGWSAAAVVLGVAVAGLGVMNAVRLPAQKDLSFEIENLPAGFEGYSLIHLTDLHLSRLFHRPFAEALVARVNALDADLILISGDLIDGYPDARRADVAPLAGLAARDGVYVSPGNHEYYFGYEDWWGIYQELGMRPLANDHARIEREGGALVIAGLTDLAAGRFGLPVPDIDGALEGAPGDAPVVLLNHQPRQARVMAARGVDLHLSGHTHGGMVMGLASLIARYNEGFISGLYAVGDMHLYVSNGTALWPGFALRLGVPSELTRITLRGRGEGAQPAAGS
ncbi:metallophosphoesterase [Salipiger mucosus]|uniref:Putative phosphoesterase n=1 Tax=Salipiger mucosus DSM 16094 TaxID=1123237 RepID=S9Q2S6_9RHOB|nr:metallophosphoesterase [Salipiger mucosus]EPX75581.1 putative phosphoesterase [Salipiger mucosus DSM 16094]